MAKRYYDEELRREQSKYFANMPDKVITKEYPRDYDGIDAEMNDNIYGIDETKRKMKEKIDRNLNEGY